MVEYVAFFSPVCFKWLVFGGSEWLLLFAARGSRGLGAVPWGVEGRWVPAAPVGAAEELGVPGQQRPARIRVFLWGFGRGCAQSHPALEITARFGAG